MNFDSLSRKEKIAYWKKTSTMISNCILICMDFLSQTQVSDIEEYLKHNELGLAAETLIDIAIEEEFPLRKDAKLTILSVFEFMGYQKRHKEVFEIYSKWANDL